MPEFSRTNANHINPLRQRLRWSGVACRASMVAISIALAPSGLRAAEPEPVAGILVEEVAQATDVPAGAVAFEIPTGSLQDALIAFTRQSGLQLVYPAEITSGLESSGLTGDFVAEDALRLLIQGSGLTFSVGGEGTVTLSRLPEQQSQGPLTLDPIVVTGERQVRALSDTLSSVAVITEDEIQRQPGGLINRIIERVPNVVIESNNEPPAIRGLQGGGPGQLATSVTAASMPRVPVIVDDAVKISALPNKSYSSLWDVEQVEVLRGPQTTLRGRSAIGGAIVVKTKDPTFEPEMSVQATGVYDGTHSADGHFAGMISGPIIDDVLAARMTVEYDRGDDPVEVVGNDDLKYLHHFHNKRLRGKLLGLADTPIGDLDLKLDLHYEEGKSPQSSNTSQSPTFGWSDTSTRAVLRNAGLRGFDTIAYSLKADETLHTEGPLSLRLITGYGRTRVESVGEQVFNSRFHVTDQLVNQDVLVEIDENDTGLSGVAGLNWEQRVQDSRLRGTLTGDITNRTRSHSGFADLRYAITPKLDLHGGLRAQFTKVRVFHDITAPVAGIADNTVEETVYLPKVGLSYEFVEDHTLGATARKGYNPGGGSYNFLTGADTPFLSERMMTYELTYRGAFQNGRTEVNATTFYNDITNPQFLQATNPGVAATQVVINADKGKSYGLEADVRSRITPTISLDAQLGLLETEITDATAAFPDLKGNSFGGDPEMTLSVGGQWQATENLSLDARFSYTGRYFTDVDNSSGEDAGNYHSLDLGATYTYKSFTTRAYVQNVTDDAGVTGRFSGFADTTRPRTFGLSVKADF